MKIGIMAAWNTNSGVAMHAEPIGKALRERGHKITVFSFHKNDYHGEGITAKDESYVKRCFGTRTGTEAFSFSTAICSQEAVPEYPFFRVLG